MGHLEISLRSSPFSHSEGVTKELEPSLQFPQSIRHDDAPISSLQGDFARISQQKPGAICQKIPGTRAWLFPLAVGSLREVARSTSRHLLALPPAGARLGSTRPAALRVHPSVGILGLPPVHDAASGLTPLWRRRRRRSPLGRWQTHADQGVYTVSGPLVTPSFVARDRRGRFALPGTRFLMRSSS